MGYHRNQHKKTQKKQPKQNHRRRSEPLKAERKDLPAKRQEHKLVIFVPKKDVMPIAEEIFGGRYWCVGMDVKP